MAILRLSPTKVGSWQDCPRKYFFTYIDKGPRRAWAHFSYGNAIHGALKRWFELPRQARQAQRSGELVQASWNSSGFRDADQVDRWRDKATDAVHRYLSALDTSREPLSVERTLAFKEDTFAMQGRIDRLDESGDSVEVIDYKTGRVASTEDDARSSPALAMYALMVQRVLQRPCSTVSLHHVPTGTNVSWSHTDESLASHTRRVTAVAGDISRGHDTWEAIGDQHDVDARDTIFPAQPGPLCAFCDAWERCPDGQASTRLRNSWEGLERSEDPETP